MMENRSNHLWTEGERTLIMCSDKSDTELADILDRSVNAITGQRRYIRRNRSNEVKTITNKKYYEVKHNIVNQRARWSEDDLKFLKENVNMPDREVAEYLHRTIRAIQRKRDRLREIDSTIPKKAKIGSEDDSDTFNITSEIEKLDKTEYSLEYEKTAWTDKEKAMVASSDLNASDLAKQLGRSIRAVYTMRNRLKKDI